MRTESKRGLIALCVILGLTVSVSAQNFSQIKDGLDGFSEAMAKSLPFNSTIGLNWSDAYIGNFFEIPPHFGVGVAVGATTMEFGAVNDLLGLFGSDLGAFGLKSEIGNGGFVLPAYTAEARIGGFFLPFDLGFKIGYLPKMDSIAGLDYLLVGGEIRYALLKGNVILPKVSIGLGVNYLSGGISAKLDKGQEFEVVPGSGDTIIIDDPTLNFKWQSTSIDFKAQVSKSFLIITPYLGLGASWASSKVEYDIDSNITTIGFTNLDDANAALKAAGLPTVGSNGFSGSQEFTDKWGFRAFGGLSVNLAVIRLDLTGMVNFLDLNNYAAFGATFGVRFQL
jgi:hypothetical protein